MPTGFWLWFLLFDGITHFAWDIVEDNIAPLRRITHKNTINDATNLLFAEMSKLVDNPEEINDWKKRFETETNGAQGLNNGENTPVN